MNTLSPSPRAPLSPRTVWIAAGFAVLLFALLTGTTGYLAGRNSALLGQDAAADSRAVLVEWEGRKYARSDLPEPVKEKLDAADFNRAEAHFQADYARVRAFDNALRGFVVHELAQKKADAEKVSIEDATVALTKPDKVGEDDARDLFEASDPSAPARDFAKVRKELTAYIEEVARREGVDRLLGGLERASRLRLHLARPLLNPLGKAHTFAIEGFPSVGPKDAPLTVVNFTDYLCEECSAYNLDLAQLVAKQGPGVRFVFVPFPYTRPDKAMSLARGAMCANQLNAYLDFHMQVVALGEHARKANGIDIARAAKIDMGTFLACYRKGTGVSDLLANAQTEARRAGVMRVPVTFVQGSPFEGKEAFGSLASRLAKEQAN